MPKETHIAVYGGAFDPPHVGHLMVSLWATVTGFADKVWVIPSYKHPFDKSMTSFDHRFNMCKEAFSVFEDVSVRPDEREWVKAGGSGYTVDLIKHLKDRYPEGYKFHLLVGSDNWDCRDKWKEWGVIERIAPPLIVGRSGHSKEGVVKLCDVSSTDIRDCFFTGDSYHVGADKVPIFHTLPLSVVEYIYRKGLYGVEDTHVRRD